MICGFIHIARMGSWKSVLADMIVDIEASGILSKTDVVYGYVCGPKDDFAWPDWLRLIDLGPDLALGECPTLQRLTRFAVRNPIAKVWYAHTKGASHDNPSEYITAWRKYMSRFVLDGWSECLASLDHHDVAGVEWTWTRTEEEQAEHVRRWGWPSGGKGAFCGNWWWARCDYLATLPDKADLVTDRWGAEWRYLGEASPRVACLHHTGKHLYHEFP